MSKEKKSEALSPTQKRELIIQAGMQAIPYVGSSLATVYFGAKQERRFRRLESFYDELATELKSTSEKLTSIEEQDKPALEAILEILHEKVESDPTTEKREFFKNYFKNTLRNPIGAEFDKRKFFLETLGLMNLVECEMVAFLSNQKQRVAVATLSKPGVDQYAIVGAIGRLKSYGFLRAFQGSFAIGGGQDNALQEQVEISDFGRGFYQFCMTA